MYRSFERVQNQHQGQQIQTWDQRTMIQGLGEQPIIELLVYSYFFFLFA